jgi:hypothetical protein
MKKIFSASLCFLVLCGVNLLAQESSRTPKVVRTVEKSQIHTPAEAEPALVTIYSNLGPATSAYNATFGFLVAGSASGLGQEFIAMSFTPQSDSKVTVIRAALLFLDQGNGAPNQIDVSLYADAGGVPGTIIAGPHTIKNLGEAGTCCALATWRLDKEVPLLAGAQYWVVADAPTTGTGSNSAAVWDAVFPSVPEAFNEGSGWSQSNGDERFGLAVLGTAP